MPHIFNTPEEVAEYLGSGGTGMPPSYAGVGQYLRSGEFEGPITEGALLALDGENNAARSEALVYLRGVSGGAVFERTKKILDEKPFWWDFTDPHGGGTFGDKFLAFATYGEIPREKILSPKLLALARGSAVEGEVERAIKAWQR